MPTKSARLRPPADSDFRVWVYVRISDDEEGTALGVERQEADCLRRVEREGWTMLGVVPENDVGASRHSKKPRPQYRRMLDSLEQGEGNAILAYSNSRLTRRPLELEELITLHDKHGVQLRTIVSGDDDLSTADGRMVARIKASVDAAEADRISERVRREQRAAEDEGMRHVGGPRPYGWERIIRPGQRPLYRQHPVEAPLLADAITRIVANPKEDTLGKIMRELNEAGHLTVSGKRWSYSLLRSVLKRPANGGFLYVTDDDGLTVERKLNDIEVKEVKEEDIEVKGIVTATLQKDLLRILSDPERLKTKTWEPRHLCSGIASCGKAGCGGMLRSASVTSRGVRYPLYRCDGHQAHRSMDHRVQCGLSIKRDMLDTAIIDAVVDAYVFAGDDAAPVSEDTGLSARIVAVRSQLADVMTKRTDLLSLRDVYSAAEIRAAVEPLNAERDRLNQRLEDLTQADAHASMTFAAVGELYEDSTGQHRGSLGLPTADDIRARFLGMPLAKRRTIIKSLFHTTVNPGRGPERIVIKRKRLPRSVAL